MGGALSLLPVIDFLARRAFLAAGLRPATITLPSPDASYTIHYWAPPGEPRLPLLVLVHGFGPRATWQWRCQVGPLSRHFHLIIPDLLGFGSDCCPSAPAPSEATQAAALAALLDALPGTAGRRVAVAGTSYGGFVAYRLAREAGPGRVGPVVVASSDLLKTAADDRAFLKRAGLGWRRVEDVLLPAEPAAMRRLMEMAVHRPPPAVLTPDFLLRDFIQKLFTENREQLIQLLNAITVGTDKFQVTPLSQEVLIIWGEHDQLFPVEKAFAVQRSILADLCLSFVFDTTYDSSTHRRLWRSSLEMPKPSQAVLNELLFNRCHSKSLGGKARLEILKKTGHAPQLEDSTRFNQIILDFLLAIQESPSA